MEREERLRLLLVDGDVRGRGSKVAEGAATVLGRWPTYLASIVWCVVFITSLILLLSLTTFLLMESDNRLWTIDRFLKLNNEYCRRVTAGNRSLVDLGYLNALTDPIGLSLLDPTNNVFYLEKDALTKEGACAVESVARLCPDKTVFIFNLDSKKKSEELQLEHKLRENYSNVHTIQTDGEAYLKGSPFEGLWGEEGKEKMALLAAEVLTVWQFGGTVLSPNLVMYSRKMLDMDDNECAVDRELLFCPSQCAAYVYELMEITIKALASEEERDCRSERIVDRSLEVFCGTPRLIHQGCNGIKRLPADAMCNSIARHCLFIRIDQLVDKEGIDNFCPNIMK